MRKWSPKAKHKSPKLDGDIFSLTEDEVWWRDHYHALESHGYRLRQRLHPDWIPSWDKNPDLRPEDCEDSVYNYHIKTTEATRISDGLKVFLKKIARNSQEKRIAMFLSSQVDPGNHCIPILECFEDEAIPDFEIIAMPLLRRFYSPPFFSVDEVLDFIYQTLEGISFMHNKNVAHRDCSDLNIMLDGTPLYPEGCHPILDEMKPSGKGLAKFIQRSEAPSVKYFFTDFGLSTHFTDPKEPRLVTGRVCQAVVPELSDFVPYNPFAVDVYLLGDVYKRRFLNNYINLGFLAPLVEAMMQRDPSARPGIHDALEKLDDLVAKKTDRSLRWKLIPTSSGPFARFLLDVSSIGREGRLITRKVFKLYSPLQAQVPRLRRGSRQE